MKVLLTHSYFIRFDQKQLSSSTPYPPLATLYAASYLRDKGHEVMVADLQFEQSPATISKFITQFKPDVFVIYDDGFNYLSKMCLTNMRQAAFQMQQIARRNAIPVIVSSSDATDHIEQYCAGGADYVIIGEAEETLFDLIGCIKFGTERNSVRGIAFMENDRVTKTLPRAVAKNLDEFPKPAWDLIDITEYKKAWSKKHGYFSLNFVTTRGCPYKCNWCAKPIYGNRYNSHTPRYVVDLIKDLKTRFNFQHIWFCDDIFGLKPGWLKEFAGLMISENVDVRYKIQSRADLLLEHETVSYLARSGCETVWMGAESGSQKILDAMDKGIKVEEIRDAVQLLRTNNIKAGLFLQFGYLNESADDIKKTIDMVNELLPDDIGISVSYPLPGTPFFEKVKNQQREKTNWTDSDDLHLMFNNTFSASFYKHLHRYVHNQYRAKQAAALIAAGSVKNFRRIALGPYYKIKSLKEKQILKKIELVAARIF